MSAIDLRFCDKEGRIYEQPLYTVEPVGYEHIENDYIHWFETDTNFLSVNNMYVKTIRLVLPYQRNIKISVQSDSEIFRLIRYRDIFGGIGYTYNTKIRGLENYLTKELTDDDVYGIPIGEKSKMYKQLLVPLYVAAYAEEEGSWTTNILIKVCLTDEQNNVTYCPITVGAEFKDEEEALIINGRNMGVSLPKDIIKCVYSEPIFSDSNNVALYNEKIKEYLLNYMSIKGECGNYRSVINSMKWFEWGDKITLHSLLRTDNEFVSQYLRQNFNINSNILDVFDKFRKTTYLSLSVKDNTESLHILELNEKLALWGEGKPVMESLFNKSISKTYHTHYNIDETELTETSVSYIRPYYDFCFTELGIKLQLLATYYEKYFLPLHMDVFTASIQHQVHTNDIKWTVIDTHQHKSNGIVHNRGTRQIRPIFPNTNNIFLSKLFIVLDDTYNNFTTDNIYMNSVVLRVFDLYDTSDYITDEDIISRISYLLKCTDPNYTNNDIYKKLKSLCKENNNISEKFLATFNKEDALEYIRDYYSNLDSCYIDDIVAQIPISFVTDDLEYVNDYDIFNDTFTKNSELYIYNHLQRIINTTTSDNIRNAVRHILTEDEKCADGIGYLLSTADASFKEEWSSIVKNEVFSFYVDSIIRLSQWNGEQYRTVYVNKFNFFNSEDCRYNSFVICPRLLRDYCKTNLYDFTFWANKQYRIDLFVNGAWYSYDFTLNMCNFNIEMGVLEYNSNGNYSLYIDLEHTELRSNIYESDLVSLYDSEFYNRIRTDSMDYYKEHSTEPINVPIDCPLKNIVIYCDIYYQNKRITINESLPNDAYSDITLDKTINDEFDCYLMKGSKYWYTVFISKQPSTETLYQLCKNKYTKSYTLNNSNNFKITNFSVYKRLLINRLQFVSEKKLKQKGQTFKNNDVICARLISDSYENRSIPFNMNNTHLWLFESIDVVPSAKIKVTSNTNMGIVSVGNGGQLYKKGYYDVTVRYNIDDIVDHLQKKTRRFKVQ